MFEKTKLYKKFKESYKSERKGKYNIFITIALLICVIIETILYRMYYVFKNIVNAIIEYERVRKKKEKEYKNSPAYLADTLANNSRRETHTMIQIARIPKRQNIIIQTKKYKKPDYSNNLGHEDFYKF